MSEIAVPVKCMVCNQTFYGPAAALIGDATVHRGLKFVEALNRHVAEKHPDHFKVAIVRAGEFQGWQILSLFDAKDSAVKEQWDRYRWKIHQATLAMRAVKLKERAREVAEHIRDTAAVLLLIQTNDPNRIADEFVDSVAGAVEQVLNELRDIVEEPGKYDPIQPDEPPEMALVGSGSI